MNHKERVAAALAGAPVDRLPVSVWGHDFLREWTASDLAAQTIEKQRAYDYDFVKINPRWTLFAEPWGNRYRPPTEQVYPKLESRVVSAAADLEAVAPADPEHLVFREHREAVALVTSAIGAEVDCLATLFSPLATLGLLAGGVGKPLLQFAAQRPDAAHRALAHISETLAQHARSLREAGAAGIFFAPLQWTSLDVAPAEFYETFGRPYDERVLEAVAEAPFNMLHVCGNHIGMARFYDYDVAVLNWDNFGAGNPSLREVAEASGKVVAGGIPHKAVHKLDQPALLAQATEALAGLDRGVLLAGGCAVGALTPDSARRMIVPVADSLGGQRGG